MTKRKRMSKLTTALVLVAGALLAFARRDARAQQPADRTVRPAVQGTATPVAFTARPASMAVPNGAPFKGDDGMIVNSPWNGDPKMNVYIPFTEPGSKPQNQNGAATPDEGTPPQSQ